MSMPKKLLTFSYDDGVTQDIRLAELFHTYGMKATFNLNSERFGGGGRLTVDGVSVSHEKVQKADVRAIYEGHEIAGHTLTHPRLVDLTDDAEIVRQVEEDRLKLSELCGYEVVGFAYPGGGRNANEHVRDLIGAHTGAKYGRTIGSSHSFDPPSELLLFRPTVHHGEWEKLFALGEEFLSMKTEEKKILYVWGHSYEFDALDTWGKFEEFLQMMSGRADIGYVTNREALLG